MAKQARHPHIDEGYPHESAGSLLLRRVPRVAPGTKVSEVRRLLMEAKEPWESITYIYVVDALEKLVGVLSIKELVAARPDKTVHDLMTTELVVAHPRTDREHVAMRAIKHHLKAIPIVDQEGKFLGIVGADAILSTLHEEHAEDFLRFAGVLKTRVVTDIFKARFATLFKRRVPWLILGLAGAMVATMIVRSFDRLLEHELAIAFFIPLIVYMSDAMGTQTQTLYIRGLVMGEMPLKKFLRRELGIALAIGLVCAFLIFGFAWIAFRSLVIAWAVSAALFLAILGAVVVALTITLLLIKMKKDPALGGGPFATIVQDIVSLVIYFAIATAFIL